MDVNISEFQVSSNPFIPAQHNICYLVHSIVVPVQQHLQVSAHTSRKGGHVGWEVKFFNVYTESQVMVYLEWVVSLEFRKFGTYGGQASIDMKKWRG